MRALRLAAALALLAGGAAARCEAVAPGARVQNPDRDLVGQSLDAIVERGWIEFAAYDALPPWSWQEDGEPRGIDVEIGRLIAGALGVEPRFRLVEAGETLEADLRYWVWQGPPTEAQAGRVSNVMLHVPYDSDFACRVEQVVFTGQAYRERIAVAYDEAAYDEPPVPAYFRFDDVAVENDTLADFYLASLAGGSIIPRMHRFPSMQEAMAALDARAVKAAMGPRGQLEWGAGAGVAVATPPLVGLAVGDWTVGVAVHMSHRDLAYAVDAAISDALADGRIAAIFEAAGLTWEAPER